MNAEKPIYIQIAETIIEKVTFDLALDEGGWMTIHELIANYMLRYLDERKRHKLLDDQITMVSNNFWLAKKYLQEERDTPVYVYMGEKNKRNIECITLDSKYNDAKTLNYDRAEKGAMDKIKSTVKEIESTAPEKYKKLVNSSQKALIEQGN